MQDQGLYWFSIFLFPPNRMFGRNVLAKMSKQYQTMKVEFSTFKLHNNKHNQSSYSLN